MAPSYGAALKTLMVIALGGFVGGPGRDAYDLSKDYARHNAMPALRAALERAEVFQRSPKGLENQRLISQNAMAFYGLAIREDGSIR